MENEKDPAVQAGRVRLGESESTPLCGSMAATCSACKQRNLLSSPAGAINLSLLEGSEP